MRAIALCFVVATIGLVAWPQEARADDDVRSIVQEEIKSYMKEHGGGGKGDFRVYWKNGIRMDAGDVKLKMGGRLMVDFGFYGDDDLEDPPLNIDLEDGVEFRRARIYFAGQISKHIGFKSQLDFADGDVSFKDLYIDFNHLRECWGCGVPNFRVGHFFEPFGLEAQTSSKYITFMERAASTNAFAPSRNAGVMLYDSLLGGQLNYGVGFFGGATPGVAGDEGANIWEDDGYGITARVGYTPWMDCSCDCKLWHIGASVTSRHDTSRVRFRARPGLHIDDTRLVNTGTIPGDVAGEDAEDYLVWGLETALVYGPWSVQAEYFSASVDSGLADDPTFSGYYVQASYWLTGECRKYKKGLFSRVKPCCDFLDEDCCCKGGWEVAARYDVLDLNDGNVAGGEQTLITLGVNWHLTPNARIMANYIIGNVQDGGLVGVGGDEDFSAFGMRFQVDW